MESTCGESSVGVACSDNYVAHCADSDRQTDRQTDRHTDERTDRQTGKFMQADGEGAG